MPIIIDTHLHSKASDGAWRPSEVVAQAKSRGLEVIALTDHDTTLGIPEALQTGRELGIRVIPGIEIDARYELDEIKVKEIELLGLGVNPELMPGFTERRAEARLKAIKEYIAAFNQYISSLDFNRRNQAMQYPLQNITEISVKQIIDWRNRLDNYDNPLPFLSRIDVVYFLLEHFALPSERVRIALTRDRRYTGEFKDEYSFLFKGVDEDKPTFYEAISLVKNAGGKAVLAHPGLSKGYKDGMSKEWEMPEDKWFTETREFTPWKFVRDLVAHGLDGVELYYYKGSDPQHENLQDRINQYFRSLADQLGIMTTFGSDCHGPKGSGPQMGKFGGTEIYI